MSITKHDRKLAESTNNCTVIGALDRVAQGDDADDVVIDALFALTHKPGAEHLLTDKSKRRLRNVLEHHSRNYKRMADAVRERFIAEIEAEGMTLGYPENVA
jgi:hypothetical protein